MNLKRDIIILVIIGVIAINVAYASWHSDTIYRDGECELFSISCPYGYKNGGELQHDSEVFISTEPMKRPYHSIVVREIDEEGIHNLYDDYDIVEEVDEGDVKIYRTEEGILSNESIAIYNHNEYSYIIKLEHMGCPYDDDQFDDDVDLLKRTANSLYRKSFK